MSFGKRLFSSHIEPNTPTFSVAQFREPHPAFCWQLKLHTLAISGKWGDGKRIRFWEDHWFGTSSLVIQFWHLYAIVNEKGATISQVWNGVDLMMTFRRSVSHSLMRQWEEICEIARSLELDNEDDNII